MLQNVFAMPLISIMFFLALLHQVLSCYRSLHMTRLKVFRDDSFALEVGKQNIRTEFLKHKIETDQAKIAELIQMVEGAEKVPRCNIACAGHTN